jgi:hypothetical protein
MSLLALLLLGSLERLFLLGLANWRTIEGPLVEEETSFVVVVVVATEKEEKGEEEGEEEVAGVVEVWVGSENGLAEEGLEDMIGVVVVG